MATLLRQGTRVTDHKNLKENPLRVERLRFLVWRKQILVSVVLLPIVYKILLLCKITAGVGATRGVTNWRIVVDSTIAS